MKKSTSGFTIVELLIVIVVIGILAAISLVAYTGVQSKARDSRRANDIALITKAIEMYRVDNGGYPLCNGGTYQAGNGNSVCSVHLLTGLLNDKYLGKEVLDPINSGNHIYKYAAGFRNNSTSCGSYDQSQNYILGATFEGAGNVGTYNCWSLNMNYKGGSNNP
jgi:type II secretion system protein G